MGLEQYKVIKLSGIGCSSKTPAYFMGGGHAFQDHFYRYAEPGSL